NLTVALDIELTSALKNEGFAREFVNRIQNLRKENDFDLTDRIVVKVMDDDHVRPIITEFNDYICAEILADTLEFIPQIQDGTSIEVDGDNLTVTIIKKGS
ncbi:MAG: DUF5915 domain-containing protein, partial [Ginsengibacter sp.]